MLIGGDCPVLLGALAALQEQTGAAGLHADLDVLATSELAAVGYPQPGGLSWPQLDAITSTALSAPGCAGWSRCIYNPELDPARSDADRIISHIARISPAGVVRYTRGVNRIRRSRSDPSPGQGRRLVTRRGIWRLRG